MYVRLVVCWIVYAKVQLTLAVKSDKCKLSEPPSACDVAVTALCGACSWKMSPPTLFQMTLTEPVWGL